MSKSVYVRISDKPVNRTREVNSDILGGVVNVDYDTEGYAVGVEVLTALDVTVDGWRASAVTGDPSEVLSHDVQVERRESTYAAVCNVCGDLGGAAAKWAVEDIADTHRADTMRVRAANLGGEGAC